MRPRRGEGPGAGGRYGLLANGFDRDAA